MIKCKNNNINEDDHAEDICINENKNQIYTNLYYPDIWQDYKDNNLTFLP